MFSGSPKKLGIPGETLSKVVYNLIEPDQYRGQEVLVVGGGDSALEAASALAVAGASVTLSYRGAQFVRAKPTNRQRFQALVDRGRVKLLLESHVTAIHAETAVVTWAGRTLHLPNHAVVVCAGGVVPGDFLRSMGVEVSTKYGTA